MHFLQSPLQEALKDGKEMKTASIYKLPNKGYIVFGSRKTVSGVRIASEPYFNISEVEANPDIIANAIKASLCNDDKKRVPHPQDWSQSSKDLLKKIGLKSLKELYNHFNKYVDIAEDGMQITFTPLRPAKKPDKGFINIDSDDHFTVSTTASNQEIVAAYEATLNKCG